MKYQTDDSLQLYSKLQSAMAVPAKTNHIDLERPITRYYTLFLYVCQLVILLTQSLLNHLE